MSLQVVAIGQHVPNGDDSAVQPLFMRVSGEFPFATFVSMGRTISAPQQFTPPRIAIVIDKRTFTRELIEDSGAFGICIPGAALADLTYTVGRSTGRDGDKFSRFCIKATPGPALGVPLIEVGCAAWLECRLIPEAHVQDA